MSGLQMNFEQETNTPDVADSPAPVLQNGGMTEMDFDQMESFPNHKFKLYEGQQLADMVESVKQYGILLPIILWHTEEGKYIILSGHNRRNAAQLAGLTKGPVITKYFTAQQTARELEETIDKALAFYFENQEREMEVTA